MLLKGGKVLTCGALVKRDVLIREGVIADIGENLSDDEVVDVSGCWVRPGAVDVHVHLRQPGYQHKETIYSGTRSAAKGGVTTLMAMPNLIPVPDCEENLRFERDIINREAVVRVYPFASVTRGEKGVSLSAFNELAPLVKGFSDDGVGVNDLGLLRIAMARIKELGSIIASHAEAAGCEDSAEAEYKAVARELGVLNEMGCRYHFCHLSTKQSFDLIRRAQSMGIDVTCEVTPHHLFLCNEDGKSANYKMNPPLRSREDMLATLAALLDGTATMIATDHAPHTREEKAKPLVIAPNGIIGLETLLPLVYTKLVATGVITYEEMVNLTTVNPAKRFGLVYCDMSIGSIADVTALDIENEAVYTEEEILSASVNSPFIGQKLTGFPKLTLVGGRMVYNSSEY